MEKKGASMRFTPQKCFSVAEFDVYRDFAIEHDLVLWSGKVIRKNKVVVCIGFGTDYGKKGASMHFAPQK